MLFERGSFKYVILDLLKDKPRHGYEIIKDITAKFSGFYSPSPGLIYPTLQMLEDRGFVKSTQENGKRVYEITGSGRVCLTDKQKQVEQIRQGEPHYHQEMHALRDSLQDLFKTVAHGVRTGRCDAKILERMRDVVVRARNDLSEMLAREANATSVPEQTTKK